MYASAVFSLMLVDPIVEFLNPSTLLDINIGMREHASKRERVRERERERERDREKERRATRVSL